VRFTSICGNSLFNTDNKITPTDTAAVNITVVKTWIIYGPQYGYISYGRLPHSNTIRYRNNNQYAKITSCAIFISR
jgi:hypothetical protein